MKNKIFNYDEHSFYIYYNNLNVNDWWILVRISSSVLDGISGSQMKTVIAVNVILLIIVSIGFHQILYKSIELNKQVENQSFVDMITNGKNDHYLKYNIEKLIQNEGDQVLISVKVKNIDYLVKILGLNHVNKKLKEFYEKVDIALNENEVIVHSSFGDFKIVKAYKGFSSIIHYIDVLNHMDTDFKLILGIYQIEKDTFDYNQMCLNTTIARSNLKENCNYGFYSKNIHDKELQINQLEMSIEQGIKNYEFKAWFQPKYKSDGKTIAGAEALVRWYKGDEIIAPYVFVPLCEANKKIKDIDLLVLDDVCKHIKNWLNDGKKMVPISVNLSRNYFDNPDFVEKIALIIEFYQIPSKYIEFEITETSIEKNRDHLKKIIDALHQKGFKISLDDFGVGYSSINTLVSMEFDTIKIDKVFVDGIGTDKWNSIIKYVISLANQLNAKTVAEGVETKEQFDFLAKNGCDMIQGYYLGKPSDASHFEKLLGDQSGIIE